MVHIEVPDILPYPRIDELKKVNELHNQYVYLIEKYPLFGISVVISIQDADVAIRAADFLGNLIDHRNSDYGEHFKIIMKDMTSIMKMMRLIKLDKSQFYFAIDKDGPILVDMRIALNKFVGPGYLRDFFGKIMRVQKTVEILTLDDDKLQMILGGEGRYSDEYIIKCSSFKIKAVKNGEFIPLYARVER